ncbi:MAG: hypothetical protein H6917_13300 [Novosphingobium sp.]|nr:hypothetical protein [Rhodobiaceae bacterium]MCB2074728.1 hypothetical protein [Novosphingobium sp.]MCP5403346.1 hypothetical protein [Novosphingobium sp.]
MARSARMCVLAAAALLSACSEPAETAAEPVDMVPGRYLVSLSPDRFAEYFEAIVEPEQSVCIGGEPRYVPNKLARVFMEPDEECWPAEFAREGNRLTASAYCPSPRRDMRAGVVLNLDGEIGAEEMSATMNFTLKIDPATVSEEDRRDIRRLGTVEGRFEARRTGDC